MSRTITALFDTRADAEAGKQRLVAARVDASNISIHDKSDLSSGSDYSTHQDRGIWNSTKNAFLPDEDRHTYEEGIRRGGVLLTADVDGDAVATAVKALESTSNVDIDERAGKWRSEGWSAPTAGSTAYAAAGTGANRNVAGEEHIPIVEEQLVVGKREVQHGTTRVRSYVTERPVQEQVQLREEHVNIERRPVDRPISGDANMFQDRTIDVTETAEEAVVGKTARVVEEVVVSKTADERVETISDTVRRTEVDIDKGGTTDRVGASSATSTAGSARSAAGGVAATAAGLGQEALGNVKQGLGSLTGNESLKRDGEAQERAGETKQGK